MAKTKNSLIQNVLEIIIFFNLKAYVSVIQV